MKESSKKLLKVYMKFWVASIEEKSTRIGYFRGRAIQSCKRIIPCRKEKVRTISKNSTSKKNDKQRRTGIDVQLSNYDVYLFSVLSIDRP